MTVEKKPKDELLERITALEGAYAAKVKELEQKLSRIMTVVCNLVPSSKLVRDKLRKHFEGKD